ncbi:MAG: UDP-N-acetylglucosamine 1-carboxyvinyltransferase [Oligoflexia bacterium]|nr:UDP-N-acetylglucosamine 1-carboxyvinyltransferase [Oligoflexia bacterium]
MSEVIEIQGGRPLHGEVLVSGAKNAALPVLIATLLSAESCRIENVPNLEDTGITLHLLEQLGAVTRFANGVVDVDASRLNASETSYSLVKALRASFWVLGPLLARTGSARVALPGGDMIGARPVDIHLEALAQMGADIKLHHGVVVASAPHGLKAAEIDFRFPSVGATHQLMMAAALVPGETRIRNAAREPEIVTMGDFLRSMGAQVEGAGSSEITVKGRSELGAGKVALIGDRIEAATYILAVAASRGHATVRGFNPEHLGEFLPLLSECGLGIKTFAQGLELDGRKGLGALNVRTQPYPGFATDIQPQLTAALSTAQGVSRIEETIYEGRFAHVSELGRLGANIKIQDREILITGVEKLNGAPVDAYDIRGAAALLIAGLCAEGCTQINEIHHLARGYERLETKLQGLNAAVLKRVHDPEDFIFSGC